MILDFGNSDSLLDWSEEEEEILFPSITNVLLESDNTPPDDILTPSITDNLLESENQDTQEVLFSPGKESVLILAENSCNAGIINSRTCLRKENFLNEFNSEDDKRQVRKNLNIASLNEVLNQVNLLISSNKLRAGNGINITNDNVIELSFDNNFIHISNVLPNIGESNKLYLIFGENYDPVNLFEEYIWISDEDNPEQYRFEKIGNCNLNIDLTPYLKKSELANTTGNREDVAMSQKATTDAINLINYNFGTYF